MCVDVCELHSELKQRLLLTQQVTNFVTFTEFPNMGSLYKKKKE